MRADGLAAGLLEDALGLARDYERILSVLRHSQSPWSDGCARPRGAIDRFYPGGPGDRKSTRLNSSHGYISYAVFCLKKKKPRNHARDGELDRRDGRTRRRDQGRL